jgi:putative copper export protein
MRHIALSSFLPIYPEAIMQRLLRRPFFSINNNHLVLCDFYHALMMCKLTLGVINRRLQVGRVGERACTYFRRVKRELGLNLLIIMIILFCMCSFVRGTTANKDMKCL